jgi:hypothetical protein
MQILLPPLALTDVNIFLAISSIILFVTVELTPSFYLPTDFAVDKKRLENAAILAVVVFLVSVMIRIISIIGK